MPFDPAIRQIIASFRQASGWNEELDLRLLQAFWPRLVGEPLARSTSVVGINGSRIVVRVPDRTWKKQLLSIRGRILSKVNEPWPNPWIKDIGFTYEDKLN
jgi:predicted nucleic acid-binding Zn ribbon protein